MDGVRAAQVVGLLLLACLEAPYDYIVVQAVPNNCNLFVHQPFAVVAATVVEVAAGWL